mmetsp:Transcript_74469/g.205277  ORF Transcript_74469/g.205277 Transcript_74469/m.205277 type:complete len:90 (-) Transcript_74469:1819-2088(-)
MHARIAHTCQRQRRDRNSSVPTHVTAALRPTLVPCPRGARQRSIDSLRTPAFIHPRAGPCAISPHTPSLSLARCRSSDHKEPLVASAGP